MWSQATLAGAEAESEGQSAEIASEGLALTVEQEHVVHGGIPRLWQITKGISRGVRARFTTKVSR